MKTSLSLVDLSFLKVESHDTPMHVASLQIFQLPADAQPGFVKSVVDSYRSGPPKSSPWDLRLTQSLWSKVLPRLERAADIDMNYHVRHTCLPYPGGERDLGELISHLHGQQLDRSRPLWTCHVIEGLEDNRFAIYTKIHHALMDGILGLHFIARCLSKEQNGHTTAPWHWASASTKKQGSKDRTTKTNKVQETLVRLKWLRHVPAMLRPNWRREGVGVALPFDAPRSVLNTPITAARRVATQSLSYMRVKAIAEALNVSPNDVFLSLCSSALRKHLLLIGGLPNEALVAGVPVSLREAGDTSASNAVGFMWANLATNVLDAKARTLAINESMKASKSHLYNLPKELRGPYTLATMSPVIGVLMSGLGGTLPPPMNTTISNVLGPAETLYFQGARLEAIYPVAIPFQGQGLNITCVNYAGHLNVCFVGSRDKLPHLQNLALYLADALTELETELENELQLEA